MSATISIIIFVCVFVLPFCLLNDWIKTCIRSKLPPNDVPPPPKTKEDKKMIIALILQGKFTLEGKPVSHFTSKRMVTVELDKKSEAKDIQKFLNKEDNQEHWGLIAKDLGWWLIIEAYEIIEPNLDLHENKYPVALQLTKEQFENLLEEFK